MKFNIQDTFNKKLPADKISENYRRQVLGACFSYVEPKKVENPSLIHTSDEMLEAIGITKKEATTRAFLNIFSGNTIVEKTHPYAMCYGGHQFGNWAGQLGDGRAINLFEIDHKNKHWLLQLKGAGETPYSRRADGLAVLRSSIREYLCSEAMHHLGVPTTRALSLILTGDEVLRDVLYDGNPAYEKGAIVCRASESFIRFGNFEIFASRRDKENLKKLTDYTIAHHFPTLGEPSKETYLKFFKTIVDRSLKMVIHWQRVGFVHGVMNTDNMSILGLTIDYGPYGWLEDYNPNWTPNTTDAHQKRYRFGAQPQIVLWNLLQLANALYMLIEEAEPLEEILNGFEKQYNDLYLNMMRSKLGLFELYEDDEGLIRNLEVLLQEVETDMTIFFRSLSKIKANNTNEGLKVVSDAFYQPLKSESEMAKKWKSWFNLYGERLKKEQFSDEERLKKMNKVNPKYVLRNYMAQLAIDDANKGDYKLLDELFTLLKKPYDEQPKFEKWFAKRPDWARNKVGCSMLSCSS